MGRGENRGWEWNEGKRRGVKGNVGKLLLAEEWDEI